MASVVNLDRRLLLQATSLLGGAGLLGLGGCATPLSGVRNAMAGEAPGLGPELSS